MTFPKKKYKKGNFPHWMKEIFFAKKKKKERKKERKWRKEKNNKGAHWDFSWE